MILQALAAYSMPRATRIGTVTHCVILFYILAVIHNFRLSRRAHSPIIKGTTKARILYHNGSLNPNLMDKSGNINLAMCMADINRKNTPQNLNALLFIITSSPPHGVKTGASPDYPYIKTTKLSAINDAILHLQKLILSFSLPLKNILFLS